MKLTLSKEYNYILPAPDVIPSIPTSTVINCFISQEIYTKNVEQK